MTKFTKTVLASLFTFSAAGASAAAFQLAEVSTSGLGMAYAGNAAVADNASVVANNPALMTQFKRSELSVGATVIDTDIIISGNTAAGNVAYASNIVPTSAVPNLYFVKPVNDKLAIGAGYNVNYGLETKFDRDFNAGTLAGNTRLAAHNFNFSAAYDLGHGFSFGAGINAIYSQAKLERHLGDTADLVAGQAARARAAAAQATAAGATELAAQYGAAATQAGRAAAYLSTLDKGTVVSKLTGNELSAGWNAGLTYQLNENHRWGVAYRSAVDVKFKGKYSNELMANLGETIATQGQKIDGRLTLNLPASWEFSGFHKLTDRLAMQYSFKRTEWSRFKKLEAYSKDGQRLLSKTEDFSDSNRYALGFSYDVNEALTLRTGIAYDQSASVKHPSISIPDTDRTWYSVGATYRFTPDLSVDAGYSYLRGKKTSFTEDGASFKTKARANIYGLNLNYKF
ncbi:hypothetical protein A1D22_10045 [Pasteurellaceae bacterium LFhippo2]|nr:hypothetical protein [Pasteurellaceae bacterium LFhippo2]